MSTGFSVLFDLTKANAEFHRVGIRGLSLSHTVFGTHWTGGRRLIVNVGFAAGRDLAKPVSHETMDTLWSPPRT